VYLSPFFEGFPIESLGPITIEKCFSICIQMKSYYMKLSNNTGNPALFEEWERARETIKPYNEKIT
jgi:hypothetical protein